MTIKSVLIVEKGLSSFEGLEGKGGFHPYLCKHKLQTFTWSTLITKHFFPNF